MTERDHRDYLTDMVEYAEAAVRVVGVHEVDRIVADETIRLALERAVEIVGEAASRVSSELRGRYPDVPWRQIAGTRNRLAHGYFSTDVALLHHIARDLLPVLIPRLKEIVRLEGADRPPHTDE